MQHSSDSRTQLTEGPSFSTLVSALASPETYPHHPAQVEVIQTHISVVFLAGDVVYKLKKPVRFSFLDYSTLALREHYCQEEVRLNRRLAPTVYLGVVPVLFVNNNCRVAGHVTGTQPGAVDYLVKMRRLPVERRLDSLVATKRVTKEGVHALAKKLAAFHGTASTEHAVLYGTPETIWQAITENFQDAAPLVGQTLSAKQYDVIQGFNQRFFAEHRHLLQSRLLQGRVCEGHGDLRCEHVYFLDEGITAIDCIEFSPRLRTCDVASELAFLAMDLDLQGAPTLAAELTHAYAMQTGDETFLKLLPFYQCYRAYVRGKVASLKSQESEVPATERAQAGTQARRAFRLATRYARGATSPALIVVCGGVGTGKSTVSRLLGDDTSFLVLNSDVVRKRLAGLLPTARAGTDYGAGIYSETSTRQTYAALQNQAEEELRAGRGVIVDATCKQRTDRQAFLSLARHLSVPVLFLECQASVGEVERRLRERERQGNSVSDATWSIARKERDDFPPFDDLPAHCHFAVNTEEADCLTAVEDFLATVSSE